VPYRTGSSFLLNLKKKFVLEVINRASIDYRLKINRKRNVNFSMSSTVHANITF